MGVRAVWGMCGLLALGTAQAQPCSPGSFERGVNRGSIEFPAIGGHCGHPLFATADPPALAGTAPALSPSRRSLQPPPGTPWLAGAFATGGPEPALALESQVAGQPVRSRPGAPNRSTGALPTGPELPPWALVDLAPRYGDPATWSGLRHSPTMGAWVARFTGFRAPEHHASPVHAGATPGHRGGPLLQLGVLVLLGLVLLRRRWD